MSVQFDEENSFNKSFNTNEGQAGGMASWLIKIGLVKDESGAKKILIAVIVVCFAVAIYLII
jgi:hypothetical protein